jgi:hypothetical protein
MAEPLSSMWWKGCMILSTAVLLHTSSRNISLLFNQIQNGGTLKPKLARSIEYMIGDDA